MYFLIGVSFFIASGIVTRVRLFFHSRAILHCRWPLCHHARLLVVLRACFLVCETLKFCIFTAYVMCVPRTDIRCSRDRIHVSLRVLGVGTSCKVLMKGLV
ncbi:hypothetical protein P280DRAFT_237430 [Massarina eburnea CBS 473.64]|uniref:Uncharacterized protein n=1 Tax=Massarina eburnea CBS 473.64 TaxID=1395130 RepID=A0A6A6RH94_9PLEO|nr:hypothetical protein P280DRAFT_237430 [Massarina eburnea CBS 473.64]